jgi:hypothetical protein
MKIRIKYLVCVSGTLFVLAFAPVLVADELISASTTPAPSPGTRYGLFNWLDSRSVYGQDFFPEPFLVGESDSESEARLDWLHTEANGSKSDVTKAEVEKAFGLMTLELEVPFERNVEGGQTTEGIGNIDLGARHPLYQFVSPDGFVDLTFGAGIELGIPTESEVSKNTELVPKIFNDTKVGNFTAQSIAGYSTLFGPGDEGGLQVFEYGFVFGYKLPRNWLPLPGVRETVPIFELMGETELNKGNSDHTSLMGDAGLRFNCKSIGGVQPRPGIAFVFPLNNNARDDAHWGVVTSLVFQF